MDRDISGSERANPSLQRWRKLLDDVALLYDLPTLLRDRLLRLSSELLSQGKIDELERFDMDEMARAACDGELEERVILYRYFRSGGYYRLIRNGVVVGEVRDVRIYFGENTRERTTALFDARIERTKNGLEARSAGGKPIGRIDGKRFIFSDGEECELVETARVIGRDVYTIDDPDIYRGVLDAMQFAAEQGHNAWSTALAERARVSIYMLCPSCSDHSARREDCRDCEGWGFVRETPDRFRWRS